MKITPQNIISELEVLSYDFNNDESIFIPLHTTAHLLIEDMIIIAEKPDELEVSYEVGDNFEIHINL